MFSRTIAAAVGVVFAIAGAQAAENVAQLSQVRGKVLVSHGKGFEAVNGSVALEAGDKIMVGKNSGAKLYYRMADCTVRIAPSSLVTVRPTAPCEASEAVAQEEALTITPAQGAALPELFTPLFVGGFLVVAGTIAVIAATDGNNNSPPVSAP